jgi:ceramide glucosyltransferase
MRSDLFLLPGLLVILLLFLSVLMSALILRKKRMMKFTSSAPPLSFIKPLLGAGPMLKENLRSFFTLTCASSAELIFITEDPNDPAWKFVDELRKEFPQVKVLCLHTISTEGWQPKTKNLAAGATAAAHEILIVSDDDVRANDALIHDLVSRLQVPGMGGICTTLRPGTAVLLGKYAGMLYQLQLVHCTTCSGRNGNGQPFRQPLRHYSNHLA